MGRLARGAQLAMAAAMTLSLSGCLGWVQYGYSPGRASHNPSETKLTPATVDQLALLWSAPMEPAPRGIVASNTRLVAQTPQGIHGLDAATGEVVWEHPHPDSDDPFIRGDLVYTSYPAVPGACDDAALQAWDIGTGVRRPADDIRAWTGPSCLGPGGMTAAGNRFVLLPSFGYDEEFRRIQGTLAYEWDTGVTHDFGSLIGVTMDERTGMFLVADPEEVRAVALPGSANRAWNRSIQTFHHVVPVTAGGRVYVVQRGGTGEADHLRVLNGATGADVWSGVVDTGDHSLSKPAVGDGTVFVGIVGGPRHGQLVAFTNCGTPDCPPAWSGEPRPTTESAYVTDPAVAGDLVYIAVGVPGGPSPMSQVEVYDVAGCGAAVCGPLATVTVDGAAHEVIVSNGRVLVSTSTGVHALGLL